MYSSLVVLYLAAFLGAHGLAWPQVRSLKYGRTSTNGYESYIVGGEAATRDQLPYQVIIYAGDTGFCGGTLISDSAVITVAHCVYKHSRYEVHLGAHMLYDENEPGRVIVTSQDASVHPNFQFGVNFDYDVAIVRLPQPVTGEYIAPVRLPGRSQEETSFADKTGIVSGWGTTDNMNMWYSNVLRYAEVRITSVEECQSYWGDVVVTAWNICASTNSGTEGMCLGDVGGPMTVLEDDGVFTLVGVANFGSPFGCEKNEPNVYARTSSYLDWIEENAPGVTIRP